MTIEEELDKRLFRLGIAVASGPSIVDHVMSRIACARVAPRRFLSVERWWAKMVQRRSLAASVSIISFTLIAIYLFVRGPQLPRAFAQQASAALERATMDGVTIKERTVMVMTDGSRHTSSTVFVLFISQDSYRRDIYDGDQLRETQWYTPDGEGMLQTSVRFDNETYAVDRHKEGFGKVNPVERMRFFVKLIDKADRRLKATMIEGRSCIGFELRASKYGDNPESWVDRIWFDTATNLPVRIEYKRPRAEEQFEAFIHIQEHFNWNPSLTADIFSPRIPAGFTNRRN